MPPSPFQALLGDDFAMLPEPVRRLHSLAADVVTEGRADITSPRGLLPWLICGSRRLAGTGQDVPVTVAVNPTAKAANSGDGGLPEGHYARAMRPGTEAPMQRALGRHFWRAST